MSLSNKNLLLQQIADLQALVVRLHDNVTDGYINSSLMMPYLFESEVRIHVGRINRFLELLQSNKYDENISIDEHNSECFFRVQFDLETCVLSSEVLIDDEECITHTSADQFLDDIANSIVLDDSVIETRCNREQYKTFFKALFGFHRAVSV